MVGDVLIQSLWSGVKQLDARTWSLLGCMLLLGLALRLIQALADRGIDALVESARGRRMRGVRRIEEILDSSPTDFERLCRELFAAMGYRVLRVGGQSDGGVDIRATRTGEAVLIQCKRWRNRPVGVKVARELLGVVVSEGAAQGVLVTTSRFTPDAQAFAVGQPLILIDRPALIAQIKQHLPGALTGTPLAPPTSQPATTPELVGAAPGASVALPDAAVAAPSGASGFPIVCSSCGRADTVPFRPRGDKPLLCKSCYAARRRRS
jgi:CxxC-x17-CxxC domain-containing protein